MSSVGNNGSFGSFDDMASVGVKEVCYEDNVWLMRIIIFELSPDLKPTSNRSSHKNQELGLNPGSTVSDFR